MDRNTPVDTDELLEAIAGGDEGAFRQLFDAYREPIFYYLVNITKSKEISEELLTDIFMKLWTGREWIESIKNIGAFLKKVSYNKAIDYLRYAARRRKLQDVIALEIIPHETSSPERILLEKDYKRIIEEAVSNLTPQRQKVYRLSREKGLTHDEIAQRLNLSPNTVSNHIKASLKSIKGHLAQHDVDKLMLFFLFYFY